GFRLAAKLFRILGQPQPAQGQFTPRHALLLVDRLFRELSAFAHPLLIGILRDHGACSDLRTPPLCPLADISSTGIERKGSPGGGTSSGRDRRARRSGAWRQVPRI